MATRKSTTRKSKGLRKPKKLQKTQTLGGVIGTKGGMPKVGG